MGDDRNIHINWDRDREQWKNQRAGSSRASGYFDTADDAWAAGRQTAMRDGVELIKHRKDNNQIHKRNTYGDDPYPPKG